MRSGHANQCCPNRARFVASAVALRLRMCLCSPLAGALLCACCAACQGPFAGGLQAFREARYAEAAQLLRTVNETRLTPEEQASWALHSGLSQLALGNAHRAVQHLAQARAMLQARPSVLSVEERSELFTAWQSLGSMPGEPLYLP